MEIIARIQAHPSRSHLHQELTRALGLPTQVMVHESDPPNPWEGYKRCLSDIPAYATHLLVVQDDSQPCHNFAPALEQIAEANPSTPVCLFLGAFPNAAAQRSRRAWGKKCYVSLGPAGYVPLVAVLWPKRKAEEFLRWSKTAAGMTRADDGNAEKWMKRTRQEFLVTVPSLVQHDDSQPSVKGGRSHIPWTEKWRSALFLAEDALDYDWLRPL